MQTRCIGLQPQTVTLVARFPSLFLTNRCKRAWICVRTSIWRHFCWYLRYKSSYNSHFFILMYVYFLNKSQRKRFGVNLLLSAILKFGKNLYHCSGFEPGFYVNSVFDLSCLVSPNRFSAFG